MVINTKVNLHPVINKFDDFFSEFSSIRDSNTKWANLPMKKKVVYIRELLDSKATVDVLPKKDKAILDDFEGKPHKPKNAFQMFSYDTRAELVDMSFGAQAKEISHRWANASADLKLEYKIRADKVN
jgi:hypothetical protein